MKKLLALNRSEIAIRILRAANELGLQTIAVYSREDRLNLHRFKADEAYQIGEGKGPVGAYLDVEEIVGLAKEKGADAIHPGYGFLSENPKLAQACDEAGITFIGPRAELLELVGDKVAARRLAHKAGIPVVPGVELPDADPDAAERLAHEAGYPLIIKASFGGGGRGMRVVESPGDFRARLAEAREEAAAAFGNPSVFLERYVRRAKHIEVQILGDRYGNVLHLYERDCSVQRRHQKVVEVAPAVALDPNVRMALEDAAVRLAREAGYYNAGTVEFLVDVETGEWFFIEVNPRLQVEHTVTEEVTGIDIVRCQIQIAQGLNLHGPEMNLPQQDQMSSYGYALQCRVTTEDPEHHFVPDYGKISTYRAPAGFGIRLDGGTAYNGAVITPYYDSLLVKITAWGSEFKHACQRMDRCLREFRVRGVKTNIQFLENVVNHPGFQSGQATTSFLDDTPALFRFSPRKDRATKLLSYLGEVLVNGNPEVAGRKHPDRIVPPPVPAHDPTIPLSGTRQLLDRLGAEKFSEWARARKELLITDTTFRDAHQSLIATRLRTHDMSLIADYVAHRLHNLFSLELWGGATFDVALRFLNEDPWVRLRRLRELIPNICFQMLLRASNAVGYTAYPDNAVREFIREAAAQGIDIFRVFDSLNWLPNLKVSMEEVRKSGKVCEAAICYTGDILNPARAKYSLDYYVRLAKELEKMGAHMLGIKDMAGLCKPAAAEKLVKALRNEIGIPVHFHTHDTSGVASASVLKAAEAGVDAVDAAIASMSGSTSQPNLNSIVAALEHTRRATGLDIEVLNRCAEYWETVRTYYAPFDTCPRTGSAEVYTHEMPGGQYTNLKEQAEAMGLGHRWQEVVRTYAEVNMAFGDIVKVTPTSKVVGDMALFLVSHGLTVREFERLGADHHLNVPNSVVEMFSGAIGELEGGWPKQIQKVVLRGAKARRGRPGARLEPVNFEETAATLEKRIGRKPTRDQVLSYIMYPEVFLKFARTHQTYGDMEILPTPQFFYGMQRGEEITVDLEPGKTLVVKFLTIGEPRPDGFRTVFFELNGQPREVDIKDRSRKETTPVRLKADPEAAGQVGAPIPGVVTSIAVELNEDVQRGDRLLVLEAMKMQTTVYAPCSGKITQRLVQPGQQVESKDLLLVIE